MSKSDTTGQKTSGTTRIVAHAEIDKYGDLTGHTFYACVGCGVDAMRRRDVRAHCECDAQ